MCVWCGTEEVAREVYDESAPATRHHRKDTKHTPAAAAKPAVPSEQRAAHLPGIGSDEDSDGEAKKGKSCSPQVIHAVCRQPPRTV